MKMSYTEIVSNISHISEEDILKNTKTDIFLAFKEAFSNALEAIKYKNKPVLNYNDGSVIVSIHTKQDMANEEIFDFMTIQDNGIGFEPSGFERFCQYINSSKGFNNKGTGRFFLLKSFKKSRYESTYLSNSQYYDVSFNFSSENNPNNMFIDVLSEKESEHKKTQTILTLYPFDTDKESIRKYASFLNIENIKQKIIDNFLLEFVLHSKSGVPLIVINKYVNKNLTEHQQITADDFPSIDKVENVEIELSKINYDTKNIEKSDKAINFQLYSAKSPDIKKNEIILTCNNQKTEALDMQDLLPSDKLANDERILLLVKSEYLDDPQNINNERQKFNFPKRSDIEKKLKKQNIEQSDFNFSEETYLFRDDLERKINKKVADMYPEVKELKVKKCDTVQKLKNRFLISNSVFDKVVKKLDINASPEDVLVEFYRAEAEVLAKKDIEISNKIDEVLSIDTSQDNYMNRLDELSSQLVELIPIQNRNNLAQYVARRKLVLKTFENILNQKMPFEIKERQLHNLFLVKNKDNSHQDSNLWMLNEDFIYFTGKSEERLCDFKINDINVFNSKFPEEEERYLRSLGENRKIKRPDILLFPEENKCIIIEFKNIDVNVAEHLHQINQYAYWLRNFANENFEFTQFYGYLIGEAIEPRDVRASDGEFKTMYSGVGLYRPKKNIPCDNNENKDGELYMEILPYSELLERASSRNKIFIEKLGIDNTDKEDQKECDENIL